MRVDAPLSMLLTKRAAAVVRCDQRMLLLVAVLRELQMHEWN